MMLVRVYVAAAALARACVLVATAAILMQSTVAMAGDATRGEALFTATCRTCHGPNSHPGRGPTRSAAHRPDVIADALANVTAMQPFASLYSRADLDDLATYLGQIFVVPPAPDGARAVEYHHAAFDHYFVTVLAAEITRLDRGDFVGWRRTGIEFEVREGESADTTVPVCRFFSAVFAPRSSHFYTADPSECAAVRANPDWTFEGNVFAVVLPAPDGGCAPGSTPVYRLYNGGRGGAPNHRFTAAPEVRAAMLARGWISEGQGALGVAMCAAGP